MKFIYTLSDPDTKEVRYIGKCTNLKKRYRAHLSNNQLSEVSKKNNWIISLIRKNKLPVIEILDEASNEDINQLEIFYIELFRQWGFKLTNGTIGGDGCDWTGKTHTEYSKLKNKMNSPHRKSVAQYDLDDNFIANYNSIREASRKNNMRKSHISDVCKGKKYYKTAGGFKWKFIERTQSIKILEPIKRTIIEFYKPEIPKDLQKFDVYDLFGNLIDTCIGLSITARKHNCHCELIKRCCDKKGFHQTKNLTFRYHNDSYDYVPHVHYRKDKTYRIGMYSEDMLLLNEFNSLKESVLFTKTGKQYISKNCKENFNGFNSKLKGFYFRFMENPFEISSPRNAIAN